MSAQYDFARPAKQAYTMDTARLHMASKTPSYIPHGSLQHSSRRMPVESASLPQTSWLSDATEFATSPLSQSYLGVGASVPVDSFLSSSLSDIGAPSYSIHRARSREYISSSPTPPKLSTSGTRSRHTPSPVPSPSHILHGARSFTGKHTPSVLSSDRDASGHLDLKRLMSKPAKQKPSASGSISLPSDSERSGDASTSRVRSPSYRAGENAVSRPPLSKSASASREKLSLHVSTGTRSSSVPGHGRTSSSPDRRPFPGDGASQQQDRPRNVLRRRPSARSNPGTPVASQVRSPSEDAHPAPRSASARTTSHHQQAFVVHDDTVFSLYTRPTPHISTARPVTSPRMKTSSSPVTRSPQVPMGLTPAGAVALAYKQQEQRREELAETASYNERLPSHDKPSPGPSRKLDNSVSSDWYDDEEGSGAYYTVFGSSSGRLVAVGSPEDELYNTMDLRSPTTASARPPPSGAKSLSRKVSGSFKKVAGSMKRERELREVSAHSKEEGLPYDGSHVGHGPGRHSPPQVKDIRKPITLDTSVQARNPSPSPIKQSPGPKGSASPQEEGRGHRSSKIRGKEDETSPGGKWWKLMKRISTGGLRDKYQQTTPPPPVPALPESLAPRMTMDITSRDLHDEEVSENGVLLRRFMQSRASLSGVRPAFPPASKSPSHNSRPSTSGATTTRPSTGNTMKSRASISGHRPSTATGSSSPASEPASTSFFHGPRAPSARSSFSSLGDEIPPVPKNPKNVGQYIMPPSELSRISKSTDVNGSTPPKVIPPPHNPTTKQHVRANTAPTEEAPRRGNSNEERAIASLPLPPRRAATTGSVSPLTPSFNVEDTINNLMPPQLHGPLPLTEFGVKEPPPRPKRSSRRGPPPAVEVPSRSQSVSITHEPATPRAPPQMRVDTSVSRRPSTGALSYASTARQVSATSSHSPASALTSPGSAASSHNKRSPLTFRELESPRQKLTDKEKADKWADLLERSAAAGGTLRVGDSHLMSEETESVSMLHLSDTDSE